MTKRISQLTALTGVELADSIPIVDNSTGQTKKATILELKKNTYEFRVRRNAAQNTGNATFAKINFDTEDYDDNNNFDSTTNYRYTAPVDGVYHFDALMQANTTSTNQTIIISLYKNGSAILHGDRQTVPTTSSAARLGVHTDLKLVAGDYVEVFAYASTTLALQVANTYEQPVFSGHLVSPE